jgi:steroid delta-isomerase-like uncharacterized protein
MYQLADRNRAVLHKHVAAETAFDIEATLATLTNDCLFEDVPSGSTYSGHDGVRAYYQEWWSAFGNLPSGSRLYAPADDFLIVETRFVGRHVGAYGGLAPSGQNIDLPVAIFVSFRDGLMAGERFYYDRASLIKQIAPI